MLLGKALKLERPHNFSPIGLGIPYLKKDEAGLGKLEDPKLGSDARRAMNLGSDSVFNRLS
jgi:hypothetical protein